MERPANFRSAVPAVDCVDTPDRAAPGLLQLVPYLLLGTFFGFITIKSEIASWYRIQEMFRFDSFHMFGVIGSAIPVAAFSLWLLRRARRRSASGELISIPPKDRSFVRYAAGGTLFGLGWALAGACPGPMLALAGAGHWPILVVLAGAVLGTYLYGVLRPRLPH